MSRLRTLWLPALVVALSALLLSRLPHARWGGLSMLRMQSGQMIILVWTWLMTLPFLGALGAAWSRREGGGRREQLLVALSPVFALAVVFGVAMLLIGHPASQFPERGPIPGRLMVFFNFVLIPTLPVLLGCVPTLVKSRDRRPSATSS